MRSDKYAVATVGGLPEAGDLVLERRDGSARVTADWLVSALTKTERPEGYLEGDVILSLSVKDLQFLFGDVTIRTEVVDRGNPPSE